MLHILFLILKIIGILILLLLGILVLSLCAVLFIPVKYEIKAETKGDIEQLSFHAKAVWFLNLFKAFVDYREKQFAWQVRLFWKRWNQDSDKKEDDDIEVEQLSEQEEEEKENIFEETSDTTTTSKSEENVSEQQKSKVKKKKQNIFQKFKCTIQKICDKIKQAWNIKEEIVGFLKEDTHQEAYGILKKEFKILLKHLRPRTLKGHLRFGMEDPYNTGRILAVLSALYPFYGEKIQIYPDFENQVLAGDIHVKGRMHLITMVTVFLRIFFNKEIRKTYQDYKTIKSEFMGGN